MVLVILAVIWAAVLIPPWIHNRRERRSMQSMTSFHRRLASIESIERTAPARYSYAGGMDVDARSLGSRESAGDHRHIGGGLDVATEWDGSDGWDGQAGWDGWDGGARDAGDGWAGRNGRNGRDSGDGWAGRGGWDGDDDPAGSAGLGMPRVSRRALRRRRQIFFTLLGAVLSSMAAALLSGAAGAWAVHGAALLLFGSYIALLVHHHQRAVEHVTKVRYLSPVRAARPAVVVLRSGTGR